MDELLVQKMPEKLKRLPDIAYNLWWSWNLDARNLFRRLDYPLWRTTQHNPVHILQSITPQALEAAAADAAFMRHYSKVLIQYDALFADNGTWFTETYPEAKGKQIAYFSFEFGLHSSLPIYSGGLGILSGDHIKEASDLGIPLVGVGFMYPQGYFRQHLPSHGWQEARYQQLDMSQAPIRPATLPDGQHLTVSVNIGGRDVHARVWQVNVGRITIYMLDTDVDENEPWDRELSARLYSGDNETRIRQELMLGFGGVRALRALGINPDAWHLNEGHSGFLVLECLRERVSGGMSFDQALEDVKKQTIFTTHTPVPAGHDAFPFHLMDKYFNGFWDSLGISREQFMSLGGHQEDWGMAFNMTVLALKTSGQANGVSKLHGQVSREMWHGIWQDITQEEAPITHVTNGVHTPTWVAAGYRELYSKYLGPDWENRMDDPLIWERLADASDDEIWSLHVEMKRKLFGYMRTWARRRWTHGDSDPVFAVTSGMLLDPDALTIGFARRFATYKRATLFFRDLERIQKLLVDVHRPVQIIFAGKAHPADDPGKSLIQQVYNLAKSPQLGGRVAFIEDYDMHAGRYMKQGVDVWLNTPRRPREASGTSGMKAAMNGVPNLSILDGWWVEGYNGANGWAIGGGIEMDNYEAQDNHDANSIYELLENEIIPLYYDRDRDGIPRGWVEIMRESIRTVSPHFAMKRMLKEYSQNLYLNAINS